MLVIYIINSCINYTNLKKLLLLRITAPLSAFYLEEKWILQNACIPCFFGWNFNEFQCFFASKSEALSGAVILSNKSLFRAHFPFYFFRQVWSRMLSRSSGLDPPWLGEHLAVKKHFFWAEWWKKKQKNAKVAWFFER